MDLVKYSEEEVVISYFGRVVGIKLIILVDIDLILVVGIILLVEISSINVVSFGIFSSIKGIVDGFFL